ncbi:MAG: Pyruvate kinase [Chlamydiia bacterium]|nr:Pyruvate kinase [Chlamydiia bacterium]MCH9618079.1 Pyruvate kinase [Chlamydiia bacterium]MCH9624201.1 Pyruvate kinase [Chlamydiia bacterium]
MRKTKVICTIGPAVSSKKGLKSLIDAGMNVCRLNFSHGSYEDHGKVIDQIKDLRKDLGRPLAILLDTKGPEVRTQNRVPQELVDGALYPLHGDPDKEGISIAPKSALDDLKQGDTILFDDGHLKGKILGSTSSGFSVKVMVPGILKPNKSVNFPGVKLNIPFLTDKDKEDILYGIKQGVEAIAASFTMSAEHILSIKELLRKENAAHILVFSKIESLEGIHHFDEILEVSDGIMVARGDLAVECSFAQVPPMQKMMIDKCNKEGKPVIVATEMLESMVSSKSPTRAEVSDVANSVFDGTSCTMLSGETAMGKHPAHTVSIMCEIIKEAEKATFDDRVAPEHIRSLSSKVAFSAVQIANDIEAGAILAFTKSGRTARRISSLRPDMKAIVITPEESTYHQTAFLFGIIAMREPKTSDHKDIMPCMCSMLQKKYVAYGDLIVITQGVPFGVSFTTNTVQIESIGNAIIRGAKKNRSPKNMVEGEVFYYFPRTKKDALHHKGKIAILREFFEDTGDMLTDVKGIILQNAHYDKHSEEALFAFSEKYQIPYIKRGEGAMSLLKEGDHVRMEPALGLVFKGDALTKQEMLKAPGL